MSDGRGDRFSKNHRLNQKFGRTLLFVVIATPVLAIFPDFLPSYWQNVLVLFVLNAMLMVGYRLITTMGGWSFAHVAIMGIGAYAMALIGQSTDAATWSFWLSLIAGPLAAALFALIISYAVLRTRHYYFFLSTFAAGEALRQCFIQLSGITGGAYGIPFVARPSPQFGMDFDTTTGFYYLALALLLIVSLALFALDNSRLGRTVKAAASNEDLSESLGVNVTAYRTFAFVVGSGVAGLAGVLFASFNGTINPMDFSAVLMFKVVAAAIVGGTATFFGPILGLLYLTALEEGLRTIPQWVPLLWGASVIAVLLLFPGGLEAIFVKSLARRGGSGAVGGPRPSTETGG